MLLRRHQFVLPVAADYVSNPRLRKSFPPTRLHCKPDKLVIGRGCRVSGRPQVSTSAVLSLVFKRLLQQNKSIDGFKMLLEDPQDLLDL